jgi:hypothetical protein
MEPSADGGAVYLKVRVQPRASRNEIAGEQGGALKIKLTSPPVDGEANAALVEFVSRALKTSRRNVTIASGLKSRNKLVRIEGVGEPALAALLDVALGRAAN